MDTRIRSVLERWARRTSLWLVGLGRYPKRAILATTDIVLLNVAMWLSMSLRLGELYVAPDWQVFLLLFVAPFIAIVTFFQLGLYRLVTRYIGSRGAIVTAGAMVLASVIWGVLVFLSGQLGIPRSVVILFPLVGTALVWGSRQAAASFLRRVGIELPDLAGDVQRPVLIYGAGTTGVRLLEALRAEGTYKTVGFIDPNPTMWGQYVAGVRVFRPDRLPRLIDDREVVEVLLAMPRVQRHHRQAALRQLESLKVRVRTLPTFGDLAAERVTVSDLRPVQAEDLLGRDPIPPDPVLLARNIEGKSVLVTGAGGSIGAELTRQILRQRPRRLVLLEQSEIQLYEIGQKIEELLKSGRQDASEQPQIVSLLGSVLDEGLVRRTIEQNGIQTIYHAAAYKHVPIVEHSAIVGLRNNTFGTAVLANAAAACGVERFVLISTDKAVRPTSVMGASKRLAELVLQALAADPAIRTVFTMVRFGNVLDSSGSVVGLFRHQIESGGPVTVTHPDMIRYFMSIPEAAGLVIQAGAMATGGEVFVLDMGEPVKIDELARSMIRLMGREVRDDEHPDGDIAIQYIGLRDGEKLYEELLIGDNTSSTEHPRIMRSDEPFLEKAKLDKLLAELDDAMNRADLEKIRALLMAAVESYKPGSS